MKNKLRKIMAYLLVLTLVGADIAAIADEIIHTLTLPKALQIIEEEAFYGDTSIEKVVVPDGTAEIRSRAFANSSLAEIELPDTLTYIADDAFAGCEALSVSVPEGCYAYDWAVEMGYIDPNALPLTISRVECSIPDGASFYGGLVTWLPRVSGGQGSLKYHYVLMLDGSEVARSEDSAVRYFSHLLSEVGEYVLSVQIEDADGCSCTAQSEALVLLDKPFALTSIALSSESRCVGDRMEWQIQSSSGVEPIQYGYALLCDGVVVDSCDATTAASYNYTADKAGQYVLRVTCTDANGATDASESLPISIVEKPCAPGLILPDDNAPASDAAAAPVYKCSSLDIAWEEVSGVDGYQLTLSREQDSSWLEIVSEDLLRQRSYHFDEKLFSQGTEETLYRIALASIADVSGDAAFYYFRIKPIETSISIDGKADIVWNQSHVYESERSFRIESELPWTASSDVSWLNCTPDPGDPTILNVEIAERTDRNSGARSGCIALSNGSSQAQISVSQGKAEEAPELISPALSEDPNAPTRYPAGGFPFEFDWNGNDYMEMRVFAQNGSEWNEVYSAKSANNFGSVDYAFEDRTNYMFEIRGFSSSAYAENEVYKSALVKRYYAYMVNSEQYMMVNGSKDLTMDIDGSVSVDVAGSNHWSCRTDVDWLTPARTENAKTARTYENGFEITAATNDTGAARTGHVTFTCGAQQAVLTLNQAYVSPEIIYPRGISQSQANPTTVQYGCVFKFNTGNYTYNHAILKNGKWEIVGEGTETDNYELYFSPSDENTIDGAVWRFTISNALRTNTYYVKAQVPSTWYYANIALGSSTSTSRGVKNLTAPAAAGSVKILLKSNGSWTASSDSSWLTLSATSGSKTTSGKVLTVSIAANSSGAARTGSIAFKCNGVEYSWLHVTQTKNDYIALFDNETNEPYVSGKQYVHMNGAKNSFAVDVCANASWSAVSADDWISFDSAGSELEKLNSSAKRATLYLSKNTTGAQRTGTVRFSCGAAEQTVQITQEPAMNAPVVLSPAFSTDSGDPTLVECADVACSWNRVVGAEYYMITYYGDDVMALKIPDDGSDSYSVTLPMEHFSIGTEEVQSIKFSAYNSYGHVGRTSLWFYMTLADAVLIDGRAEKRWKAVSEAGAEGEFTIRSNGAWNASSGASWLKLGTASGVDGDTLQVTAEENPGAKRTGTITVTSGSSSATLTVTQYAALLEDPLLTPEYSASLVSLTVLTDAPTSLHCSWTREEQVGLYEVELYEMKTESSNWHLLDSSGTLSNDYDDYDFSHLALEAGRLYRLELGRRVNSRWSSFVRYFTISDGDADFIDVDNMEPYEMDFDEDEWFFAVQSSGQWVASVSDDWLMVGEDWIDAEDLTEWGDLPSDHSVYRGNPGDGLTVSALANTTGSQRNGTVTIRCGSAVAEISFVQEKSYTMPALTSPVLSETKKAPTELCAGALNLHWTAGEGGTGKYMVRISENDTASGSYTQIFSKKRIYDLHYTLDSAILTEGMYYHVELGMEVTSGSGYYTRSYYFHYSYSDPLHLEMVVSQTTTDSGSALGISAQATGGAGSYKYAFELWQDGIRTQRTTWQTSAKYSFILQNTGTYRIHGYVMDRDGTQYECDSENYQHVENIPSLELSRVNYSADAEGATISLTISASQDWIVTSTAAWISSDKSSGTNGKDTLLITIDANAGSQPRSGSITFAAGSTEKVLTVDQAGKAQVDQSLMLSCQSWNLTDTYAAQRFILIESDAAWRIENLPGWISVSMQAGTESELVLFSANANEGVARTAEITVTNGATAQKLYVAQPGIELLPEVASVTASTTSPQTGEDVTYQISTRNADSVTFVVDNVFYESIPVYNGSASFVRSFSTGGARKVQFMPSRGNLNGLLSSQINMQVASYGALSTPNIQEIGTIPFAKKYTVQWSDVPHADYYSVFIQQNGVDVYSKSPVGNSFELPLGITMTPGTYTLLVVAVGKGYSQSQSLEIFTVVEARKSFSLDLPNNNGPYVLSDGGFDLKASNPDEYNLAFIVEYNGIRTYYPSVGTYSSQSIQDRAQFQDTGSYKVSLAAYVSGDRTGEPWATIDGPTVQVNGPLHYGITVGKPDVYNNVFNTASTNVSVVTNNAPKSVDLYIDGAFATSLTHGELSENYRYTWTGTIPVQSEGQHTYYFKATDDAGNVSSKDAWSVVRYVITAASGTMYPNGSGSVVMKRNPFSSSPNVFNALYPCETMTIQGKYGAYYYGECRGGYGFVHEDDLLPARTNTWDGLSVELLPNEMTVRYIKSKTGCAFMWDTNLTDVPDDLLYYRFRLENAVVAGRDIVYPITRSKLIVPELQVAPFSIAAGAYYPVVEVVSRDGKIVYTSARSSKCYTWTDDASFYLECVDGMYSTLVENTLRVCENMINGHMYFVPIKDGGGRVFGDGQRKECSKLVEVSDWDFTKAYQIICSGQWDEANEPTLIRNSYVAENIMASLSTRKAVCAENAYILASDLKEIFEKMGLYENAIDIMALIQTYSQYKDHFSIEEIDAIFKDNRTLDLFEKNSFLGEFKSITEGTKSALGVIKKFYLFDSVDEARLKQIIAGLRAAGGECKDVAIILEYLQDPLNRIWYLLASYGFEQGEKWAYRAFKGLMPKSWALSIEFGSGVCDMVLNINDLTEKAAKAKWSIMATQNYYTSVFKDALSSFRASPVEEFDSFKQKAITFAYLHSQECKAISDFYDAQPDWNKETELVETYNTASEIQHRGLTGVLEALETAITRAGI